MNGNEPQATPLAYLVSKFIIRIPNNKNWFNFLHYNEPIARNKNENTINTRLKQLTYIGINEKSYQVLLYPKPYWYKKVDLFLNKKKAKTRILYILDCNLVHQHSVVCGSQNIGLSLHKNY